MDELERSRLQAAAPALLAAVKLFTCSCPDRAFCYLHDREFRASVDAVPGERRMRRQLTLRAAKAAIDAVEG